MTSPRTLKQGQLLVFRTSRQLFRHIILCIYCTLFIAIFNRLPSNLALTLFSAVARIICWVKRNQWHFPPLQRIFPPKYCFLGPKEYTRRKFPFPPSTIGQVEERSKKLYQLYLVLQLVSLEQIKIVAEILLFINVSIPMLLSS